MNNPIYLQVSNFGISCSNLKLKIFTLIELLLIIAIISILTSMLLPALKSARNTTKKIACINNLKTFGTSIQMYTSDNNEWMPTTQYWYNSEKEGYICNYMGGLPYDPSALNAIMIGNWYNLNDGPWRCPADNEYDMQFLANFSYGWNHMFPKYDYKLSASLLLKYPSQVGTFTDCNDYWAAEVSTGTLSPIHTSGLNILFLDAHVEWRNRYGIQEKDVLWDYYFDTGKYIGVFGKPDL